MFSFVVHSKRRHGCAANWHGSIYRWLLTLLMVGWGASGAVVVRAEGSFDTRFFAPGVDGEVTSLLDLDDQLIFAGRFQVADDQQVPNVAAWDGDRFIPLGTGLDLIPPDRLSYRGRVLDLLRVGPKSLVAAGQFDVGGAERPGFALWDGVRWTPFGGLSGVVGVDLASFRGEPAAIASKAGGGAQILIWNGQAWDVVPGEFGGVDGSHGTYGTPLAVTQHGHRLVVAGYFDVVDGRSCRGVAAWDGETWSPIGYPPVLGLSQALASHHGYLFLQVDQTLYRWTGSHWELLFEEVSSQFVKWGGDLYVRDPGGALVRWDSGSETFVYTGRGASSANFEFWRGRPYFGGVAGRESFNSYSPSSLEGPDGLAVGSGLGLKVNAPGVFVHEGDALITGRFGWVGKRSYFRATAVSLTGGTLREIREPALRGSLGTVARGSLLCWTDDGLYGYRHGVAKPLTGPFPGVAFAGADHLGEYYIGGRFFEVESPVPRCVYRWDGANWIRIGNGLREGMVTELASYRGDLYAAGTFADDGGPVLSNIARWDGAAWQPMDGGVSDAPSVLMEFDGDLVVAGNLSRAGALPVQNVARWDGSAWHVMGAIPHRVTCLAIMDGALYAGTGAGRETRLYRWSGDAWEALPFTFSWNLRGIAALENQLWIVGDFVSVGGVPSRQLAIYTPEGACGRPRASNRPMWDPSS
ncbi:MAG: hypothetical protein IPK72_24150 [Candidatus Eisenbacteria bacterium]|nr:hypothetical protein [Candidatus Eisenbacteria bacterium]